MFSDDFNRANSVDLGSSWDVQTNEASGQILNNKVRGTDTSKHTVENYNGSSFSPDQFARCVLATWTGAAVAASVVGVALRCATAASTYYGFRAKRNSTSEIYKLVAGSFTSLASVGTAWALNDTIQGSAEGTALTMSRNLGEILQTSDGAIVGSGRVGLVVGNDDGGSLADIEADDFIGGVLSQEIIKPSYASFPKQKMRESWIERN
jgi:hypothetical protein